MEHHLERTRTSKVGRVKAVQCTPARLHIRLSNVECCSFARWLEVFVDSKAMQGVTHDAQQLKGHDKNETTERHPQNTPQEPIEMRN